MQRDRDAETQIYREREIEREREQENTNLCIPNDSGRGFKQPSKIGQRMFIVQCKAYKKCTSVTKELK